MDNFIYYFLYHIFSILLMNTDSFGQYVTISFLQPKAKFWFSHFWVVQGICLLDFFQTLKQSHILGIKFQHWPLNILTIYIASCKDEIRMSHNLGFKVFYFLSVTSVWNFVDSLCIPSGKGNTNEYLSIIAVNFYFPPTCMCIRGYRTNFLPNPSSATCFHGTHHAIVSVKSNTPLHHLI